MPAIPQFSRGRFAGLDFRDISRVFGDAQKARQDTPVRTNATAVSNEATWIASIQGADPFGDVWKYYGVEVYRNGYGVNPWPQVTNGRVMNNTDPGQDTTYGLNRSELPGDAPLRTGTIVTVFERYDEEGSLVRDIEAVGAGTQDVYASRVTFASGATNATYSAEAEASDGISVSGMAPFNRWTTPGLNWKAAPVGYPCLIYRYVDSGITTYHLHVEETPVSEECESGASESNQIIPASSAGERLYLAANYR